MRIISSGIALDLILALTQRRDGARLTELSTAAGTTLSPAQAAIRLLLADRLIERERGGRPRYRLRWDHPAVDALAELAITSTASGHAFEVVLRANPAVEFAARDRNGYLVVESPLADPRDVALLDGVLAKIPPVREGMPLVERYGHRDLVDRLVDDPAPRHRAARAKLIKGSLARSFPVHVAGGRRRALPRISRRALASVARTFGLDRVRLFGSGARGELHGASDVDVVITPKAGRGLSLLDLIRLETELEELFKRHVDVVTEGGLRPSTREHVEREAVTLYGRA
jgi:predicted nucleotidyltransferase